MLHLAQNHPRIHCRQGCCQVGPKKFPCCVNFIWSGHPICLSLSCVHKRKQCFPFTAALPQVFNIPVLDLLSLYFQLKVLKTPQFIASVARQCELLIYIFIQGPPGQIPQPPSNSQNCQTNVGQKRCDAKITNICEVNFKDLDGSTYHLYGLGLKWVIIYIYISPQRYEYQKLLTNKRVVLWWKVVKLGGKYKSGQIGVLSVVHAANPVGRDSSTASQDMPGAASWREVEQANPKTKPFRGQYIVHGQVEILNRWKKRVIRSNPRYFKSCSQETLKVKAKPFEKRKKSSTFKLHSW